MLRDLLSLMNLIKEFMSNLTKSDKLFLFGVILDHCFGDKEVLKKVRFFLEAKYPYAKREILDWFSAILNENDHSFLKWREWIEENLGQDFAMRFERKAKFKRIQ